MPSRFEVARERIGDDALAGVPFGALEEAIDRLELDGESKDALWLYAWSIQEQGRQRYAARQALVWAGARGRGAPVGGD